ncbi:unnamed protein product, partial [Ectocarpus fasciculatus]
ASSSPEACYASQANRREGNPFEARIAAHAGCIKKLWRARYLALREERRMRRREERTYAYPSFINPPRYD